MASPALPFKIALEEALRASAALPIAMDRPTARIYTEVEADAPLPYVVIGNDQVLLDNSGCAIEAEVFATVSLWSRVTPRDKGAQARAMGAAIVDALNLQLAVAGWTVDEWELQTEHYSTDPDQSTKGVLVFHYLLSEQ